MRALFVSSLVAIAPVAFGGGSAAAQAAPDADVCHVATVDLCSATAQSGPIPGLLQHAISSSSHCHYTGRREVQFHKGPHQMSHEEIVYRDGPRTRVEFPVGSPFAGEIIVETATERRHYIPDKNEVFVQPPRHEESFDRLVGLERRAEKGDLSISVEPGEHVAGWSTTQVVVADKAGNITQRLFIEPKSGIVLKRQLFDPGGALIGSFEFSQIDMNPPFFEPSLFRFERKGVQIVTPVDMLRDAATKDGFDPVVIRPSSGFRLDSAHVAKIEGDKVLIESYWAKAGKLTLFELKTDVSGERLQRFARDELHSTSFKMNGKSYVLVASIPMPDLLRIQQTLLQGTP